MWLSVAHRWVNTHTDTSIESSHSWLLGHFGLASLYSQKLLQFSLSTSFSYTTLLSHFLGTLCKWSRECNFIEFYLVTFTVLLSNISHSVRISFSMGLGLAVFVLYYLMFVNVPRFFFIYFHLLLADAFHSLDSSSGLWCIAAAAVVVIATAFSFPKSLSTSVTCHYRIAHGT